MCKLEDLDLRERLSKVEEKVDNIEKVVFRIEDKIEGWTKNFVSKDLMAVELQSRDQQIHLLREDVREIQRERITEQQNEKMTGKQILVNWALVITTIVAVGVSIFAAFKS